MSFRAPASLPVEPSVYTEGGLPLMLVPEARSQLCCSSSQALTQSGALSPWALSLQDNSRSPGACVKVPTGVVLYNCFRFKVSTLNRVRSFRKRQAALVRCRPTAMPVGRRELERWSQQQKQNTTGTSGAFHKTLPLPCYLPTEQACDQPSMLQTRKLW